MPKFDMKKHEERMRAFLRPPALGSPLEERIKTAVRKRRLPRPPSRSVTSGV